MEKVEVTADEYEEYLRLRKVYRCIKDNFFDLKKKIVNLRVLNEALIDNAVSQDDLLDVLVDVINETGKSFDVVAGLID